MTSNRRPMDRIRASRKLLENPYAYIEDLEEQMDAPDVFRAAPIVFAPRDDHASPPAATTATAVPVPMRSSSYRSGNPYANIRDDEEVEVERTAHAARSLREEISKADFRSEATRIILSYISPHQGRRLAQHQRDFIARNERRPSNERYRVLAQLKRYDLSTTPGLSPQFNRELRSALSEEKLRRIESDAGVS